MDDFHDKYSLSAPSAAIVLGNSVSSRHNLDVVYEKQSFC